MTAPEHGYDGALEEPLDADLAAVIDEWEGMAIPPWPVLSLRSARELEDELFTPADPPPVGTVRDLAIDGPGPDASLPIRVYRPADASTAPVLVHYHGGGWVLGTLDSTDGICRRLTRRTGCVVVSVDYRLAPEHPFPAAVDDAYAALEWTHANASWLGGDPDRIGVSGTSAGGNLAAATALRARECDGPVLAVQVLLYPILDRDFTTTSYREHADDPLLSRSEMRWFWTQYTRSPVDRYNPFAAPLRADRLDELAPAVVATAGYDPLRDEGIAYAEAMERAGTDVALEHFPSLGHGFLSLVDDVDAADRAFDRVAERVRERL